MGKKLEDYNFFDEEVLEWPFDFYKLAQQEAPVYKLPGTDVFLVTRYADIKEILMKLYCPLSFYSQRIAGSRAV